MAISATNNSNLFISVQKAQQLYGVTQEELKTLNPDGDDKITYKELQAYGVDKNKQLTNFFTTKITGANPVQKTQKTVATNPFTGNLKNAFSTNFNQRELSPRVDSDLAPSVVGNVFPRLYA